ncbi:SDR family oxidoreductase [Mesorhizobium sp. CGMCC 1.15528]|uniref:SDR family oxidoreductase n=1 Tax=Mesorhizobium zhangyense TaxID=1776730 RepID=A0A7C9R699_9HYPH|nr:SDR family oxidoreductase [Mesorhizobium zhangyense]NGN40916.1 SDR family oxidoreductase [Mesorhizobium zhangyense]
MRVLILGGSGFIGSAVAKLLSDRGNSVTALARDVSQPKRRMPQIEWISADIARLLTPEAWLPLLKDIDAVVNCAGALQDSARDNVAAVQYDAMRALYEAAGGLNIKLIVQISARAYGAAADLPFLSTKQAADDALKASGVPFVVLKPAVIIGRNTYGGSALLRALAAFPLATPLVHADAQMQFASLDDVTAAVADAVEGEIEPCSDLDLAAPETLSLSEAVAIHRQWLGLPPAPFIAVPAFVARAVASVADLLGGLGWRSPMRSTALDVAAAGVSGHFASPDRQLKSLSETLADMPAGVQELWFARLYLLKPVIFGTLSLFWILSGAIALLRFGASTQHLVEAGASSAVAAFLTFITSVADIALGLGVIARRHSSVALKGMIALSLAYLAAATFLTPGLWVDPLGPLVKVLPSIALALVALAILDER